ncbi:MAG: precorrin-6y C5,15-methyltransferase (decarboxylating) subunit CbiE [Cyanobacteria bacterium P01_A01_bin.105]
MQPKVHVIGLGLEGLQTLTADARAAVDRAGILVGAERQLAQFPDHGAERWPLGNLQEMLVRLQRRVSQPDCPPMAVLTSGDPLFFGLGRLLVTALPAEQLRFYPNVTAVQLAFSRLQIPWQQACIVSIHGRSCEPLQAALKQGQKTIAVIGDPQVPPAAIAAMVTAAPWDYQLWCCENLGSPQETIQTYGRAYDRVKLPTVVAPLHIWVLRRQSAPIMPAPPLLGIPDDQFARFDDRPGLMTKRPVRTLILTELELHASQIIWDIGAGTGSVSIEMARLSPESAVYAVEKSAAGNQLIQTNRQRFAVENLVPISGAAPDALMALPDPHRVFMGGHGGQLPAILHYVLSRLRPQGRIVIATTTLDSHAQLMTWLRQHAPSQAAAFAVHHLQVNLAQSTPLAGYQRLAPLNPVMLTTLVEKGKGMEAKAKV